MTALAPPPNVAPKLAEPHMLVSNGLEQEQQAEPEEQAEQLQVTERLHATCWVPSLTTGSIQTTIAHLSWEAPCYKEAPADQDLPSLNVASYQVYWAEVTYRGAAVMQPIADDDWRPLPSGDVGVPEVKVGGLRPGKAYAVRVCCTLDMQHISTEAWDIQVLPSPPRMFTTLPTVPSPVKPPLLVARERKALKVKWNIPDEPGGEHMALTYQLFMAPPPMSWVGPPGNAQGYVEVYQGSERTYKVQKLVPGARYSFWVLARNTVGFSEPGQVAAYTTQATVPAQPEPPRQVSCTQSSITLQWVAPPGNGAAVSNYVLERDDGVPASALAQQQQAGPAAGGVFQMAYAGPLQTVMVGGLRSGLHYRFRLRAENDEGASFWSECCVASPAPSTPSCPSGVNITSITQQAATVSWAVPAEDGGSPVLAHEVELQAVSRAAAESMGSDWLRIFEGCISACTISSLQPGCTYRVRVRCANSAGWGGWCMPVELTTAPDVPGAPGAPAIQQAGTTCLTLTWQPPRHNGGQKIAMFLLEVLPPAPNTYAGPNLPRVLPPRPGSAASSPVQLPASLPGAVLAYRGEEPVAQVVGLQPGMMYQFRVQARNSLGVGPWGDWSTLGTAAACPSAPMPPCLAAPAGSHSLRVNWQAPDAQGSPIQGYVLEAAVQGTMTSNGQLVPQRSESVPSLTSLLQAAAQQHVAAQGESGQAVANGPLSDPQEAGQQQQVPDRATSASATSTKSVVWQEVYKGEALNAEITQLQPCTRYLMKVAAINQVGRGDWSPIAAVTTAPAAPTAPHSLCVLAIGPYDIKVEWQAPAMDHGSAITGYTLDMAPMGLRSVASSGAGTVVWQQVASTPATQQSASVSGLQPGRVYQFRVRAANACGASPFSAPAQAVTMPAPPSAPMRLAAMQRAATQVKARWEEPQHSNGAPVSCYRLEVADLNAATPAVAVQQSTNAVDEQHSAQCTEATGSPSTTSSSVLDGRVQDTASNGDSMTWVEVYQGSDTTARVAELQPGCQYMLRVRARNAAGWGPTCTCDPFTTALAPPGAPEGLEACLVPAVAEEDGAHNVLLRWLPPALHPSQALVASYELHAKPANGSVGREVKRVVGKACECVVDQLHPGQRYSLRVRAAGMEGAGHGTWSEPVEMVMPGHTRGVTDSADSMSAASGTNDGLGSMGPNTQKVAGLDKSVSRRLNASSRAGRQQGKWNSQSNGHTPTAASVAYSENEDAMSVASSMTAALANGIGKHGAAATLSRSRINTTKLTSAVAVQKRPKNSFLSMALSKETLSFVGLRKLYKNTCKSAKRQVARYKWQLLAVLTFAFVAWLLRWAISHYSMAGASAARVRSPQYW